jgi:hypothetical protein
LHAEEGLCQSALSALLMRNYTLGVYTTPYDRLSPLYIDIKNGPTESDKAREYVNEIGSIILKLYHQDGKLRKSKQRELNKVGLDKYAYSLYSLYTGFNTFGRGIFIDNFPNFISKLYFCADCYIDANIDLIGELAQKIKEEKNISPRSLQEYISSKETIPNMDGIDDKNDKDLTYMLSRLRRFSDKISEIGYQVNFIHELGHFLAALQMYQDEDFYLGVIRVSPDGDNGVYIPDKSLPISTFDFYTDESDESVDYANDNISKQLNLIDTHYKNGLSPKEIVPKILTALAGPNILPLIKKYIRKRAKLDSADEFLLNISLADISRYGHRYDIRYKNMDDLYLVVNAYFILLRYTNHELFEKLLNRETQYLTYESKRIAYDIALLYHYSTSLVQEKTFLAASQLFDDVSPHFRITRSKARLLKESIVLPPFIKSNYWENFYHDRPMDKDVYVRLLDRYPDLSSYIQNFLHTLHIMVATQ